MTLQKATLFVLAGTWINLLVSLFTWGLALWDPGLYYGNQTVMRGLWLAAIIIGIVPYIIFFNALRRGQGMNSGSTTD